MFLFIDNATLRHEFLRDHYFYKKLFKEYLEHAEQLFSVSPMSKTANLITQAYYLLDMYDQALHWNSIHKKIADDVGHELYVYRNAACIYHKLGREEDMRQAMAEWVKRIDTHPNHFTRSDVLALYEMTASSV
jgi:hypothetical protein